MPNCINFMLCKNSPFQTFHSRGVPLWQVKSSGARQSKSGTYESERAIFVKCIFCIHSQGTLVSDAFKQSEDWHIEQVLIINFLLGLLLCTVNTLKILIISVRLSFSNTSLSLPYSVDTSMVLLNVKLKWDPDLLQTVCDWSWDLWQ